MTTDTFPLPSTYSPAAIKTVTAVDATSRAAIADEVKILLGLL